MAASLRPQQRLMDHPDERDGFALLFHRLGDDLAGSGRFRGGVAANEPIPVPTGEQAAARSLAVGPDPQSGRTRTARGNFDARAAAYHRGESHQLESYRVTSG